MVSLSGKKVLLYLPSLELGGSERFGLSLARYLKEQCGADVEVWGVSLEGRLKELCAQANIPSSIVPLQWNHANLGTFRSLVRCLVRLRRAKPDVILAFTLTPSVVCGIVWRCSGAKLFVWNQRDTLGYRMGLFFDRLAARNTPLFISNSDHGGQYLARFFHADPARIRVVYNAVELPHPEADRSEWRKKLSADTEDLVAVMVANLHGNKDHETLIRAWRLVHDSASAPGRKTILALAGYKGESYGKLTALAEELGIRGDIRFLGQVNDVSGLLHAADMAVFSSRTEGMPNGVLECMAAGLPVVGTDIPGIREAVSSDNYDHLVPAADHQKFAESILKLAGSAEARRTIGRANRLRIQTTFDRSRICGKMAGLIRDGLEQYENSAHR